MALPLLQSDDTPLETGKISISDKSWMGSALSLGGVFGNILFGFVVSWIGARHTIVVIGLPQLVSKFKYNFVKATATFTSLWNFRFHFSNKISDELALYDLWNVSIPFDYFTILERNCSWRLSNQCILICDRNSR